MPAVVQARHRAHRFCRRSGARVGHRETSEIDILEQAATSTAGRRWSASMSTRARERIAQLPWVEVASVRKVYPRYARGARSRSASPSRSGSMAASFPSSSATGSVIAPFTGGRARRRCRWSSAPARPSKRAGFIDKISDVSRACVAGEGLHPGRRAALGSAARQRHHRQAARRTARTRRSPSSSGWTTRTAC